MDEQVFIKRFANSYEIELNRYSCLIIALKDARKITGRNVITGSHELNMLINEEAFLSPYSFIGAINYLLILDMVGEIFRLNNANIDENKTNNIYKSLKQFALAVTDKDIDTIIALRNSLAHNYGLINIPKGRNIDVRKQHKFYLINSQTSYLIEYPITGFWNGDFADKSDNTSTKIGYEKLIDLVESVYRNLINEIEKGTVSLALPNGLCELKARFTIVY